MKVCHLTSVHAANDNRIFYKECCSLVNAGFDVTLIAPAAEDSIKNGVKIVAIKPEASRIKRMLTTTKEVYQKALEVNATVYHFHDPELIPAGLKLKQQGKKVIYDVHEDVPRQMLGKPYLPRFSRQLIANRFEKYENKASKHFDHIITVTPLIETRFKKVNPRTTQVCNFPSLEEFTSQNEDHHPRKKDLCYAGSISEMRGIREMIMAIEEIDGTLHLAGNFSPSSLQKEMQKLSGWKKIIHHGYLGREEIRQLYAHCSIGLVLLHPTENYMDAYPIKMFEYMAAGLAVIASGFPLWRQITEGNQCGICVDPLNIREIRDAILYLQQNAETAAQMGVNGRKAVVEKYNWQVEEKKLIAIYNNLQ
jgi:glycosyltransferase involved in cell wall biosynthesis